MKVCIKCNIEKNLNDFGKRPDSKDGHRNDCKSCRKEFNRIYKIQNKDDILRNQKKWKSENKEYDKEYYEKNKEILILKKKEYNKKNKEILILKNKIYREKNKELIAKRKKDYYDNNREKENSRKDKWHKKKILEDPNYKMRTNIRSLIYISVKNAGYRKSQLRFKKTELILGCKIEFFIKYIEEKFLEGMSWENHGKWHLDHIKSISLAENEEDVYILNNYTNFQPLWAFDNLSKGNKYEE
jgi:hypothetical protein